MVGSQRDDLTAASELLLLIRCTDACTFTSVDEVGPMPVRSSTLVAARRRTAWSGPMPITSPFRLSCRSSAWIACERASTAGVWSSRSLSRAARLGQYACDRRLDETVTPASTLSRSPRQDHNLDRRTQAA
jgi:hypothetical protein